MMIERPGVLEAVVTVLSGGRGVVRIGVAVSFSKEPYAFVLSTSATSHRNKGTVNAPSYV